MQIRSKNSYMDKVKMKINKSLEKGIRKNIIKIKEKAQAKTKVIKGVR